MSLQLACAIRTGDINQHSGLWDFEMKYNKSTSICWRLGKPQKWNRYFYLSLNISPLLISINPEISIRKQHFVHAIRLERDLITLAFTCSAEKLSVLRQKQKIMFFIFAKSYPEKRYIQISINANSNCNHPTISKLWA